MYGADGEADNVDVDCDLWDTLEGDTKKARNSERREKDKESGRVGERWRDGDINALYGFHAR